MELLTSSSLITSEIELQRDEEELHSIPFLHECYQRAFGSLLLKNDDVEEKKGREGAFILPLEMEREDKMYQRMWSAEPSVD